MRRFVPELPPKDIDDRIYRCLENLNNWAETAQSGFGAVSRGYAPDGSGRPVVRPGVTEHHNLGGLVPVTAESGRVTDYNDDHSQYALLFGRPDGQYLYGSRHAATASWGWSPQETWLEDWLEEESNTYVTNTNDEIIQGIPVGAFAVLVLSTSFYHPTPTTGGEDTNFHLTLVSHKGAPDGNTWTKAKEYATTEGTQTQRIVSVWYSHIADVITTDTTTLAFAFDTPSDSRQMGYKALTGYWWKTGATDTIALVDAVATGEDDGAQPASQTLTVTGPTLYLRGICARGFSTDDPTLFTPTGGFTSFAADYTNATGTDPTKIQCARGEWQISDAGTATSSPSIDTGGASQTYDLASAFLAFQLNVTSGGLLNLGSWASPSAANILLSNQTIYANMDYFYFRDAPGTTNLSYIQGSDGAFVGNTLLADDFMGTAIEPFDATVSESGGVVSVNLEQTGGGDLRLRFSDGLYTFDCTPAATKPLTPGTDAAPTGNYVYILKSDKALTVSAAWPSTEHAKIAYILCPSATFVSNDGPYINQNWNDAQKGTNDMGHMAHIGEKIRLGWGGGQYFSGVNGAGTSGYLTLGVGTTDFKSSSGVVYQMHKHTFPAFDTSTGDTVLVKNWSGDAYHAITDLFDITADSTGTSIGNNKWFNLVVWGVANKTGTYEPIMINLPSGSYNTQVGAEGDTSNYDDYAIPREFGLDSSTAFLICRITVQMNATWVYGSTLDLRGQIGTVTSGLGGLPEHDHYSTSATRATTLYTEMLSVGNVVPLETPNGWGPIWFQFTDTADDRSIDGARILVTNQSTNIAGLSRALYLKTTPYSELDGTIIGMERDVTNGTLNKTLAPAITLAETYGPNEVDESVGMYLDLAGTPGGGATRPPTIVGFKASVREASASNIAFLAERGDIAVQSDNEGLLLGDGGDAYLYYNNLNLVVDPRYALGSGNMDVRSSLLLPQNEGLFWGGAIRGITYDGSDMVANPNGLFQVTHSGYGFSHTDGTRFLQTYVDATGGWFGTDNAMSLHLYVNSGATAALELDTSNDAHFLGSLHLNDNEKLNLGNSNDATLYFSGGTDTLLTLNTAHRFQVAGKLYVASGNRQDSASLDFNQTQVTGNGTIEAASELRAMNVLAQTGNGANKGRNFAVYYGARVEVQHNRTSDIDYASREARFVGGDFRATYANTGQITGNGSGSRWVGGDFTGTITGTKNTTGGTVAVEYIKGGVFNAISAGTQYTLADAMAGHFMATHSGVAPTRNYGILVSGVSGGTTEWGINVDGADIQISSNNYLLLEGSTTTKGDTGLRYNSATSEVEFDVNGTTEMKLLTDGIVIPVKGTTGDPTGQEGMLYFNSADGNLRFYSSGAWSSLHTGL